MNRVLITGASSFIGVHLIKALLKLPQYEIIAVVRRGFLRKDVFPNCEHLKLVEYNMDEYHHLDQLGTNFDCFVHLAWNGTRGADRNNVLMQEENVQYSMNAVQAAIRVGCKKIISAGSQAEYGLFTSLISETTPCKPVSQYGIQKLHFFELGSELCGNHGIPFIEPRFFSLYGPNDSDSTMIMSILRKMLKNEPCDLTECIQKWDFLHIDDAIRGVILLIQSNSSSGAYNFGSGDIRTLRDFVEQMKIICNSQSKLCFGAVPYPLTGIVSIEPDIRKLKSETGWNSSISFQQGIEQISYHLKGELYEKN